MGPDSAVVSGPHAHSWARPTARLLAWSLAFVLAGYAGRATIIDGGALSLVWPAAGISALWLASAHGRLQRGIDALAFAACTFVVNLSTGASVELACVFVVSNLLQVAVFLLVMRQLTPHLWGFGGSKALVRLRDLGALVTTATMACLVGASVGSLGLGLVTGTGSGTTWLVWWGRNTTGLLTIGTVGLLLVGVVLALPEPRSARATWTGVVRAFVPTTRRHAAEVVAISGMTALLMAIVFFRDAVQPLAFLLLFATVMAGVRFRPLGASIHGLLTGAVAIVFTIAGDGPFAAVTDVDARALLAQVFVSMAVVTGLVLAFSRAERDSAIATLGATLDQLVDAERGSAEQATMLAAVLDHIREGIVVLAADGTVLLRNEAGRRLLGLQGPASPVLQPVENYGLVHPDGQSVSSAEMPYTRAFAGEEVRGEDFRVRSNSAADGVVVEIGASPMPGPADEPPRVVVHFRDVTAIRQERDSLAAFAGVVAHDLSNPLTALRGWAQVLGEELAEGALDPAEGLQMVGRIQSSGALMSQFIDDLLSYTLSRDTRLTLSEVDLTAVAREVAALRSEASPVETHIDVQDGLVVHADPLLTRQLLDNLIGNAVKYVAPGVQPRIQVCGRVEDDWLHVQITDNGIGVPEEMRQRIFENFQRAHAEEYRGTGIGLAICRRVVLRHGGTISVNPIGGGGTGSRFEFTLPAGQLVTPPTRELANTSS